MEGQRKIGWGAYPTLWMSLHQGSWGYAGFELCLFDSLKCFDDEVTGQNHWEGSNNSVQYCYMKEIFF